MYKLEELQLYIGMKNIPKSWDTCFKNALSEFKKDWLSSFDTKSVCTFYNLPDNFMR